MKNKINASIRIVIALSFALQSSNSFSQAFGGKGTKQFLLGLGLTNHFTIYPENGKGPKGTTNPLYGCVSAQLEFGIAKYVGIGGTLGFEFANNLSGGFNGPNVVLLGIANNSSFRSIGIPIGVFGNFHFLQLIADKTGKTFAEKMDVYGGLSFGSGPAFAIAKNGSKNYGNDVGFLAFGGPHVGFRYFPSSSIGVFVEAGYGKSYVNGGMALKF